MPDSGSYALVRAKGFGGLPDLIEREAGERAVVDIFEREGLPVALRDMPKMPMPLRSMVGLFDRAANAIERRTLGLEVGEQMTHRGYGLWIQYAAGAASLGGAIRRAITSSWAHLTGARLELVTSGDHRVVRFSTPAIDISKRQYSDHLLPPMLTFLRLYLGPQWLPDWAEVDYARDQKASLVEERLQTGLRFDRPASGLAIKNGELARKRSVKLADKVRIVTLRDVLADVTLADAPERCPPLSRCGCSTAKATSTARLAWSALASAGYSAGFRRKASPTAKSSMRRVALVRSGFYWKRG